MISNETLPINGDKIAIYKVKITYCQELDCCQSAKDYPEELQYLTLESDDGGAGKFIRMKVGDSGWSFSTIKDLEEVLADFKKRSGIKD